MASVSESPVSLGQLNASPAHSLDRLYFDYLPDFIPEKESSRLLALLWKELEWRQYDITLFGRLMPQPRLSAWYGESGTRYKYSGLQLEPMSWHPELEKLRSQLEEKLGESFNSVLANAYRNGNDSMGWHADDEKELGEDPLVASISLGAARRFLVRRKNRRGSEGIWLESGSLLVMKRGCQSIYRHAVPKTGSTSRLRLNLTFRNIDV